MAISMLMPDPVPKYAAPATVDGPRLRKALLLKCGLLAASVMFIAEVLRVFVGSNFHSVAPGLCYRSAQPTAESLENAQRALGIRTIINLRGENEDADWYQEELETARRLHIDVLDAGLCSKVQVPDDDFHIFVQAVKDAKEPILIHCANGNDRSGLASAVYLLMRTDTPINVARQQLGLRYGHFAIGKALALHRVLDSYEAWLDKRQHTGELFYYWGMHVYHQEVVE
jgi:protein tyrosine phosphatase (PTP) superfamily phosphohydrolase (DUF442 family)